VHDVAVPHLLREALRRHRSILPTRVRRAHTRV
jgi:hypothetical protein